MDPPRLLPADPEFQLRITRSATESILEGHREDDRRQVYKRKRRLTLGKQILGTLRKRSPSALPAHPEEPAPVPASTRTANEEQDVKASVFDKGPTLPQSKRNAKDAEARRRRNVWLNSPLPMSELNARGDPATVYPRNKISTAKYSLLTFIPKNLFEQFRRVANLYFLATVILQIFPMFGAAAPSVAALPLLAILALTALKDGIEDWRRHILDNAVNNSAVTRLADWLNVNVAQSQSSSFLPFTRKNTLPRSKKVSRGVAKLRAKEGEFVADFLYNSHAASTADLSSENGVDQLLQDLENDSQKPTLSRVNSSLSSTKSSRHRSGTTTSGVTGVVDYSRQTRGTARWERTLWKKLEVGDVVLLSEDDQIPADLVVLSTSDPDGVCFVETKNLDGETNLKPKRCLRATQSMQHEEDVEHAQFVVDSEPPNANLYSYNGVLRYTKAEQPLGKEHPIVENGPQPRSQEIQEAITVNELLLRGCTVRNVAWIIGIVVFTGSDTKIMLNQGDTPSKRSHIEKETNFNVIANFVILIAMCLSAAIANGLYIGQSATSADFYEIGAQVSHIVAVDAIVTFASCLIAFQNIVPISLVITVELVKTIQAYFIHQDVEMYYEPLDYPCVPKSWNLSDDLGQIEYVFSDKTGTLTSNIMEFKKCTVQGQPYGQMPPKSNTDQPYDSTTLDDQKVEMTQKMRNLFKHRYLRDDKLTLISPKLVDDIADKSTPQRQYIMSFFRALALCHTVLVERPDPNNQDVLEYKAESPDEAALVSAARDAGFAFLARSNTEIEIQVLGQPERYTPLRILEFNSTRKRMSMILRQPDGRIVLLCKGADSILYQRLRKDHDQQLLEATSRDLEMFANEGLRTLCVARRYITEEEFATWATAYDAACAAVEDREDEIERACELIEHDLEIIGGTALEDKLQEGVPAAIEQLHRAGLKLWILTGDKLQTAIEIGYSCNLLTSDMELLIISAETEEGARVQIESGLEKVKQPSSSIQGDEKHSSVGNKQYGVVIDGETLRYALADSLKPLFLDLTTRCKTVVCCRVSPAQKALTVRLVKEGKKAMCLAIGDGANDVAMIQEAHIGIGIAGLEGAQAAMSADYAIGQFRYLTRLLLVHGRWCYIRIADMHACFFYKNVVFTLAMYWFLFSCFFDGTYLFDYTLILLYNLAFTSLPVGFLGAFDQDVSAATALAFPQLYQRGISHLDYTRTRFWLYMLDGCYQSAVVYIVPYFVFLNSTSISPSGRDGGGLGDFGTTVAACAVVAVTFYVGLNTRMWSAFITVVLTVSCLLYFVWILIYSAFPLALAGITDSLFATAPFYGCIILTQVIAIGPRFVARYIKLLAYPIDNDIIREHYVQEVRKAESKDQQNLPMHQSSSSLNPTLRRLSHNPIPTNSPPPRSPITRPVLATRHSGLHDSLDQMSDGGPLSPVSEYALHPDGSRSPRLLSPSASTYDLLKQPRRQDSAASFRTAHSQIEMRIEDYNDNNEKVQDMVGHAV